MRIRITIYKKDSKGKERITECRIFENATDANDFILEQKAEPKE
jgi:hypothetical protein